MTDPGDIEHHNREKSMAAEERCMFCGGRGANVRCDCHVPVTRAQEVARLREALWEQWRANHAEHCGGEWPHPAGGICHWPLPHVLADGPVTRAADDAVVGVPTSDLRRIQNALETALFAVFQQRNVVVINKALFIVLDHLGSPMVTDQHRKGCRE